MTPCEACDKVIAEEGPRFRYFPEPHHHALLALRTKERDEWRTSWELLKTRTFERDEALAALRKITERLDLYHESHIHCAGVNCADAKLMAEARRILAEGKK